MTRGSVEEAVHKADFHVRRDVRDIVEVPARMVRLTTSNDLDWIVEGCVQGTLR